VSVPDTFPKLLARNVAEHGAEIAMREKQFGIWRSFTPGEIAARTQAMTLGLHALGVGARSLGLYRDALDDEVAYLLGHAGAKLVFAEDE